MVGGCNDKGNASSEGTATVASRDGMTNSSVDNSSTNAQDRSGATLTPGDQGNSDGDRSITQRIRQQVVSSTNNYTTVAKNIKIITVNGKVTLRGPVNTEGEKTGIDAIAKSVAGDGNVDDQLAVKANP